MRDATTLTDLWSPPISVFVPDMWGSQNQNLERSPSLAASTGHRGVEWGQLRGTTQLE